MLLVEYIFDKHINFLLHSFFYDIKPKGVKVCCSETSNVLQS